MHIKTKKIQMLVLKEMSKNTKRTWTEMLITEHQIKRIG